MMDGMDKSAVSEMLDPSGYIGLIDSGVGGLTVAKELMRLLPREPLLYLGDTARCPYGPRPAAEVRQFVWELIRFMQSFPLKMLVIACNTATATMLQEAKDRLPIPVIGVIQPGVRAALQSTRTGRIGVIGTEGTINSMAYPRLLHQGAKRVHVVSLACPRLVPLVEKGDLDSPVAAEAVRESLQPLLDENLDTLILGCTHYPLLSHLIAEVMGPSVELISSAMETAKEVAEVLRARNAFFPEGKAVPEHRFFITGTDVEGFSKIASKWLRHEIHAHSRMVGTS